MNNQDNNGTGRAAMIDALLKQSKGTDIPVLIKAKEMAKKAVSEEPSNANLAALQRVSKMLEDAEMTTEVIQSNLKGVKDVLLYIQNELGRKVKQAKLYQDIKKGLLRRDKAGGFNRREVDKYATTLPMVETPEHVTREVWDAQRRKDEADIRIKEADARRKELAVAVAEGKLIARDIVDQELAARAVAFNAALKTAMEARALEFIQAVGGEPKLAHHFLGIADSVVDDCCNRYAQPMEIEVTLDASLEDHDDSVDSDTK